MKLFFLVIGAGLAVVIAGTLLAYAIQPNPMESSGPRPRLEVRVPSVEPCLLLEQARAELFKFGQSHAQCESNSDCAYAKGRCPVPIHRNHVGAYEQERVAYLEVLKASQCNIQVDYAGCPADWPGVVLECSSGQCQRVNVKLHETLPIRDFRVLR